MHFFILFDNIGKHFYFDKAVSLKQLNIPYYQFRISLYYVLNELLAHSLKWCVTMTWNNENGVYTVTRLSEPQIFLVDEPVNLKKYIYVANVISNLGMTELLIWLYNTYPHNYAHLVDKLEFFQRRIKYETRV